MKATRDRKPKIPFEKQLKRNENTGCLEWTGRTVRGGYGAITIKRKTVMAHRFWFVKCGGVIPDGMVLCHTCDNPKCVEPGHLFVASQAENMADMVRKKRQARGTLNSKAKLTESDVVEIRKAYKNGEIQARLAAQYNVHQTTISLIIKGKNWKHIPFERRKIE